MKNLTIKLFLLMLICLSCSTLIFSQESNDTLMNDIEAVLDSDKSDRLKKRMAQAFIERLKAVYVKNIDNSKDSDSLKKVEKDETRKQIAEYEQYVEEQLNGGKKESKRTASKAVKKEDDDEEPTSGGAAQFLEVPQNGDTSVQAKGDAGNEYQFSVDGNDAGKTTAIAGGLLQKTVPELVAGSRVVIKPVNSKGVTEDGKGVAEEVGSYIDPTKGGMFGVLVGGAVLSQQNSNFSSASPFFGFNAGYGTKVYGANRYIGKGAGDKQVVLIASSNSDSLTDTFGRVWKRDYKQPSKLIFTNGINEVRIDSSFQKEKSKDNLVKLKTSCFFCSLRAGFRVQGIFEADARAAEAETEETPTAALGGAKAADPFTFLSNQQTFTTTLEGWLEFRPLRQFSFGPYASVGASSLINRDDKTGDKFVNDNGKSSVITKVDNDIKRFHEFGGIFNLKFLDQKFFMQSIFAYGRYEAYKDLDKNVDNIVGFKINDTRNRFVAKMRMFPEGLNTNFGRQIKLTPMFGIDLNSGTGPDNLRFFTGFTIRLRGITRE